MLEVINGVVKKNRYTTDKYSCGHVVGRLVVSPRCWCCLCVCAQAWLRDKVARALGLLTLATVVFRCDVVVLLAPLTLQLLLTR